MCMSSFFVPGCLCVCVCVCVCVPFSVAPSRSPPQWASACLLVALCLAQLGPRRIISHNKRLAARNFRVFKVDSLDAKISHLFLGGPGPKPYFTTSPQTLNLGGGSQCNSLTPYFWSPGHCFFLFFFLWPLQGTSPICDAPPHMWERPYMGSHRYRFQPAVTRHCSRVRQTGVWVSVSAKFCVGVPPFPKHSTFFFWGGEA